MNNERQIQPAPEAQARVRLELEQIIPALVTPERARLIAFAATQQKETLSPITITRQAELDRKIREARADDLPFEAGGKVSEKRREEYWKEEGRGSLSFAEQNNRWNESVHQMILTLITMPEGNNQQEARKSEDAKETLRHLGLTGADATQRKTFRSNEKGSQTFALYSEVEVFRMSYFDQKSDIKGFVRKIAEQCPSADDSVDIVKLKERLDAIKPLLASFGDQSLDDLVADYAISYGLLTQKNQHVRDKIADETKNNLQSEINDTSKKLIFANVLKKQEEIDREKAGQQQAILKPEVQVQALPTESFAPEQREEEQEQQAVREVLVKPEPPSQQEDQVQETASIEFAKKQKRIEEKLSEELGAEIKLSPKQKDALRNMPITEESKKEEIFIDLYFDGYYELKDEDKSHDEIMNGLDKMFDTLEVSEDEELIDVSYSIKEGYLNGRVY